LEFVENASFQPGKPAKVAHFPQIVRLHPFHHQFLASRGIPILLKGGMALLAKPHAFVVAKAAFQRLATRVKQLAAVVFKKSATAGGVFVEGKKFLTAFECRRKDGNGMLRRNFQHHTVAIPGTDCPVGFGNRPPSGARAISQADIARARLGGRKFLIQVFRCWSVFGARQMNSSTNGNIARFSSFTGMKQWE